MRAGSCTMTSSTSGPSVASRAALRMSSTDPRWRPARVDQDLQRRRDVGVVTSDRDDACDVTQGRLEAVAVSLREAQCDGTEVMRVTQQLLICGPFGHGVDAGRAAECDMALPSDRQGPSASVEHVCSIVVVDDGDGLLESEILGEAGEAVIHEPRAQLGASQLVGEQLESGDGHLLC